MRHTFVVSCNYDYLISLTATLNAAKFYGTTAEFSIAYDNDIPKDLQNSISDSFPFKINWYPIDELFSSVTITAKTKPSRFWVSTWVLAAKLIDDYDSIAILQADEFLLVNVNNLFKIAAQTDIVIATEYTCVSKEFEELPFGTTKSITARAEYALYDQLVFMNKTHKQILIDVYEAQCIDAWKEEAQDPMCALNQACATHLTVDQVLGLEANIWCTDRGEWEYRLCWDSRIFKLYNDRNIRINGIHCRPWQNAVIQHGVNMAREKGEYYRERYENGVHNFNLLKDLQAWFNSKTPITKELKFYTDKYE